MAETEILQRIYTVPFRRVIVTPKYRRANRTITMLKEFAEKHMKSPTSIKISPEVNEMLWSRGIQNPPRKITVKMVKDEEGIVTISLPT